MTLWLSVLLALALSFGATTSAAAETQLEQGAANWATSKVGSTSYRYLCLKFVYDAWIGSGMSRANLDSKSGYISTSNSYPIDQWNYWMAGHPPGGTLHVGVDPTPPVGAIIYYSNQLGHDYSHATISVGGGNQISPDTDQVKGPQPVTTNSYRTMLGWWLPDLDPGPTAIAPVGSLDVAQSDVPGQLHVAGWARDGNDPNAALTVHIYIGGPAGTPGINPVVISAGVARGDVGAHGYDVTLTAPSTAIPVGSYQVCSYAINIGPPSTNPQLGCKSVTVVNPNPNGSVDGVIGGGNDPHALVYGSAIDPNDLSAEISIRVWVGGHAGDAGATAVDLGPTGKVVAGQDHTYNKVIAVRVGTYPVCIYALNIGPGTDSELGCRTLTVDPPAAPAAPTNVVATAGNMSATLSWTDHGVGTPTTSALIKASPGGKTWAIAGASTTAAVSGLTNGTGYSFTVTLTNAVGTGPASTASNTVTPTAPVAACPAPTSPTLKLMSGSALTAGATPTLPVRVGWAGTSGCSYVVEKQTGTTWSAVYSGVSTGFNLSVAPYTSGPSLRVKAVNSVGMASASTAFPARGLDGQQDTQFTYPNGKYPTTNSVYWGGNATLLTAAGVDGETNVLADQVAIVATTGPYYGAVKVYIDGKLKGTVDTYSSTEKNRQVVAAYTLSRAPHSVNIVAEGTAGRPAVLLDGIASLW